MTHDPHYLLNAPDGIARYEAHEALKRRDAAEVIPMLVKMLEEGHARYPSEIADLLNEVGGRDALTKLLDHPDKTIRHAAERALARISETAEAPTLAPKPREAQREIRRERSLEEKIAGWVRHIGAPLKPDQEYARVAHQRLVEMGAPAVPALVSRLQDSAARKRRFAVLQVLGDIAAQGVPEALGALQAASQEADPGIARPASVVLEKLNLNE